MNSSNPSGRISTALWIGGAVFCGLLVGVSAVVIGIASYFRLSPDANVLRASAMEGVQGTWHKKIALNVGFLTTGLIRAGSHCLTLPPEPRAALDSLRAAEVGVYRLQGTAGGVDHRAILARADRQMSARRWDRVVGVSRERELVAIYVPMRGVRSDRVGCCVLVLQDRELVVVRANGNLEPLLELAEQHLDLRATPWHFASLKMSAR